MTIENDDVKIAKYIAIGVAICFLGLVFSISGFQAYNASKEASIINAETEQHKIRSVITIEQNQSIKKLIDDGINPIAARCAVIGWETTQDAMVCSFYGKSTGVNSSIKE